MVRIPIAVASLFSGLSIMHNKIDHVNCQEGFFDKLIKNTNKNVKGQSNIAIRDEVFQTEWFKFLNQKD